MNKEESYFEHAPDELDPSIAPKEFEDNDGCCRRCKNKPDDYMCNGMFCNCMKH